MKKKSQKNKRKSEMNAMFFIILLAAVMFIISTYAWFSTQKNVSITNLSGAVEVAEGLEISLDAKNWYNGIVLGTEEGQKDIIKDAYEKNQNLSPTEMLPVSTLGLVSSETMENLKMIRGKVTNSIELSEIDVTDETVTDSADAKFPGYFAFDVFLKNSSKDNNIDDILQLNFDSSLEVLEAEKSVTGLQNTARVAFVKYDGTSDVTEQNPDTILKQTTPYVVGSSPRYIDDIAIWEPNAGDHVDFIVNQQITKPITWSSVDAGKYATYPLDDDGSKGFGPTTQIPTYGLTEASINSKIDNIYVWDGSEKLLQKQNVLQTNRNAEDDYKIKEGVQDLLSTDGTNKFTIAPNKISRIRIYVWLEGQDVDCINWASHGGGIKVNIGLVKGSNIGAKDDQSATTP